MMHAKDEEPYSKPLAERVDESEEDLESLPSAPDAREHSKLRRRVWTFTAAAAVLIVSNIVSARVGAHFASGVTNLDSACAAHTTQWSPVLKDVDVKYDWKHFNGSFMQEDIFRKEASPEVDTAWESMGVDYRAGVISIEDGLKSGLDMSFVRRSEKYGAGFFVNVEGLHHLHCLNLLRKSLYYNYDYYKSLGTHAFKNEEHIVRLHVSHCLDTIRQVLVCNADTGVLGQVWANDPPSPFPDFNTKHMCKNYEAIQKFAEKIQAPPADGLPDDYIAPPGPGDVFPQTP
ncbi:tat pathway signal sequence [Colletotrichum tofieldiae]|uniref:Tat pathway signal sequence n=1 Tax=Colletotrichum tofieldiae TaxID=708197 RepID=A0A161YN52_9PEZI|nr:tat pathway signal sequence [Colletotrichum tofieldiae]